MAKVVATLIVTRGERGKLEAPRAYDVPYTPGQSVLDGLRYIRAHLDPGLSVRHSCINANMCKECLVVVDGRVEYACTARLEPRTMRLEPLPRKAHLRDLVTEIAPPDERLDHAIKRVKSIYARYALARDGSFFRDDRVAGRALRKAVNSIICRSGRVSFAWMLLIL